MADARDARLETRLADLGRVLDYPAADLAASVGAQVRSAPAAGPPPGRWPLRRPLRRGLLIALAALVLAAAAVAAAGILLPGLRITFVPPGASDAPPASAPPSPSHRAGPLGSTLGLGIPTTIEDGETLAGLVSHLPAGLGPPDAIYVQGGRLTLLWASSPRLPATGADGVGLLLTQFRGRVEPGYYEKVLQLERTTVEAVGIGSTTGYWIAGAPHFLLYRDGSGRIVEEQRRIVGDALIWADGEVTYRIESALGRAATVDLAESLVRRR